MKVFVTGAEGFIGLYLVERLINFGFKVNVFTFYNFRGSNCWLDSIDKNLLIVRSYLVYFSQICSKKI